MSAPLTAYRPVPSLLTSLSRAGWGDLAGRDMQGVRTVLTALTARLPHKSGQGDVTVNQVADAAGLSPRWVRRCMTVLEDLGLIEWQRGGVQRGNPMPSFVRIVKTVLVELIEAARPIQQARETARALETRARIAAARLWWCGKRRRWSRGPGHAALSARPHPIRGVDSGNDSPEMTFRNEEAQRVHALAATLTRTDPEDPTPARSIDMSGPYDAYTEALISDDGCAGGHGGEPGLMASGLPRCPMCRRHAEFQQPEPKPQPKQLAWAIPGGTAPAKADEVQKNWRHGR